MSPDRLDLPPGTPITLELLFIEMKHLVAGINEMKESCKERKLSCSSEIGCLFERVREIEKGKPLNPSWIYAVGIALLAGIEMFRLLHWLK